MKRTAILSLLVLLVQVPFALCDLWGEARGVSLARRAAVLRASESARIASAFATTPAGWRPELWELGRAQAAAEASVPLDKSLQVLAPKVMLEPVCDRFAALLYPRKVRLHTWPLGDPLPAPAAPYPEHWVLRVGEPGDTSADPAAEVLAAGKLFTLWHSAGAQR